MPSNWRRVAAYLAWLYTAAFNSFGGVCPVAMLQQIAPSSLPVDRKQQMGKRTVNFDHRQYNPYYIWVGTILSML